MLARRIAAATMVVGLGGASLAGVALVLATPAVAASPAVVARPQASGSADPSSSASAPAPVIPVPTSADPQPTDTATDTAPTDAPTAVATTAAAPSVAPSPTAVASSAAPTTKPKASATASARLTATPRVTATRSITVYRTYAPVTPTYYNPNGVSETGAAYPYTGAAGDLPSGAAATGAPLTTATVKASTSADPVYVQATSGATTSARKYIDVNGISIDGVLADAAIAGGILGLLGGAGLWFTRGAR